MFQTHVSTHALGALLQAVNHVIVSVRCLLLHTVNHLYHEEHTVTWW